MMRLCIFILVFLIGTSSLVSTSSARTRRFETWTSDESNQDLNVTPTGTGRVNIGGDGITHTSKTTAQISAISSPDEGQIVYDSTLKAIFAYLNSAWVNLSNSGGTQIESVKVTDGSSVGTVSEDSDNLIDGNMTHTDDTGLYVGTFQNAYPSAPHCWVQSFDGELIAYVTTTTTTVDIQFRQMCTSFDFTPVTSWSSGINWTGKGQRCGVFVDLEYYGSMSGGVTAAGLTITHPNSWEVDTSKLAGPTNQNALMGGSDAVYHDTGTNIAADQGTAIYNGTTSVKIIDNGNTQWSNVHPKTWATGDEIWFRYRIPVSGLDERGAGTDTDFILFCKEQ